jgi:hypothetical protein
MTGSTRIAEHLSAEDVRMKMQMTGGFLRFQKWLVIYNAIVDPRPVSEIAMHTGLSEASVSRIIAEYNKNGPEALDLSGHTCGAAWFDQARPHSM